MRGILPDIKIAFVMLCFAVVSSANAQDLHYSQFYNAPLSVNPALSGVFDGKFRLSNIYRSQWSGLGKGYTTLHISGDAPIGKGMLGSNFFGIGFMIAQDKAGEAGYKSSLFEGS